jgi:hypothetical protein
MTAGEFGTYLVFAAGFCLVLAVVNAVRGRFFLAGACLAVASGAIAYRASASDATIAVAGVTVAMFLVGDLATRLRRNARGAPKQ